MKTESLEGLDVIVVYVGILAGDLWMSLTGLRDFLKKDLSVGLVVGTYTRPIWDFALEHVKGLDGVRIIGQIADPDEHNHPFCPGKGFHALVPAYDYVKTQLKERFDEEKILRFDTPGNSYGTKRDKLELKSGALRNDDRVTLHGYTRHGWKNCDFVVYRAEYNLPTFQVGFADEPAWPSGRLPARPYSEMVLSMLHGRGLATVLSSFNCIATVFHKPAVVASYTSDCKWVNYTNPNALVMVTPSIRQFQDAVSTMGW